MMKKKGMMLTAALVAAFLTLGTACRGNTDPEIDPDKTNVTVWVQLTQVDYFKNEIEKPFETANPDINLIIYGRNTDQLDKNLDVTLGGKNAPDVAATWGGQVAPILIEGNKLEKLDDVITPEIESKLVAGAVYNSLDGDGEWFEVPLQGFASPVIFYNKTWFKSHGFEEPETYEELVTIAQAIRGDNKQPLVGGFNTWHLPHFMQALHARTMKPENFDKLIGFDEADPYNNDEFAAGFSYLKKMNDDGILADNITGYDAANAMTMFGQQKALMVVATSSDLPVLKEQAATWEIGSFPVPPAPESVLAEAGLTAADLADAPIVSGVYSDVLVLNAKSKVKEAAKKFLSYVLTAEAQEKLLKYDMFPVRGDVSLENANPDLQGVLKYMNRGVSGFYQSYSVGGIDVELVDVGGKILSGSMTSSQAAAAIGDFYKKNRA